MALEGIVLKEPQSMEEFLDSLAIHSNVVSKSNGLVVTPSSGPAQYGPLFEVDKATPTFVLGSGDGISETLNSGKRNVRGTTKKNCKPAEGEGVKKDSKGTWKHLEKSPVFEEVVMGDQNEDSKRKLEAFKDTKEEVMVLTKKSKLEDAVSLGKVFEEQFGSAEVAKQTRRKQ